MALYGHVLSLAWDPGPFPWVEDTVCAPGFIRHKALIGSETFLKWEAASHDHFFGFCSLDGPDAVV